MKLIFELDDTGAIRSVVDDNGETWDLRRLQEEGIGRLAYAGEETHLPTNIVWPHRSSRGGRKNAMIFDDKGGLKRSFPPPLQPELYRRDVITYLCLEIKREER